MYYNNYYDNINRGVFGYAPNVIPKAYNNYNRKTYMDYIDQEIPKKRSGFNRVMSVLGVTNYITAGFVMGFVDDEINPIQGAVQGLMAANPLGEEKRDWKYSYTDVLSKAGWNPESKAGKVAKFATGMAMDIFLDPGTYISGGVAGVMKGTGKHAFEGALGGAEAVSKAAKYSDTISDVYKATGMTQDIAETIVKNSNLFKSGKFTIDVSQEALSLANKYNKVMGKYDKAADITLSLANAPFGKKIFGKYSDKVITLVDGNVVREFGDKTIAPLYGVVRNGIYGSKLADLFSTSSKLYDLGKSSPEEFYNFMKSIQMTKGRDAGKFAAEQIIRKRGKELMNLTPSQQKEVLDLMQNPSKWQKVENTINFFDTKEAMVYKKKLEAAKSYAERSIDAVVMENEFIEQMINLTEKELGFNKKAIDELRGELASKLLQTNEKYVVELGKTNEMIESMKNIAESLSPTSISKTTHPGEDLVFKFKNKTEDFSKPDFVDELSEYLFGSKGFIYKDINDNLIDDVVTMIENGDSIDKVNEFIFKNKDMYTGKASEMYKFIAKEVGYKSWHEEYTKRINEINKKLINYDIDNASDVIRDARTTKDYTGLTYKEQFDVINLQKKNLKRTMLLNDFKDTKNVWDVRNRITEFNNLKVNRDIDEIINSLYNRYDNAIPIDELNRRGFIVEDYKDIVQGTSARQFEIVNNAMTNIKPGEKITSVNGVQTTHKFTFNKYNPDDGLTRHMWNRMKDHISENGYVTYKREDFADKFLEKMPDGWRKEVVNGEFRLYPPQMTEKDISNIIMEQAKINDNNVVLHITDTTGKTRKVSLGDGIESSNKTNISKYKMTGNERETFRNLLHDKFHETQLTERTKNYNNKLNELMDRIRNAKSPEEVVSAGNEMKRVREEFQNFSSTNINKAQYKTYERITDIAEDILRNKWGKTLDSLDSSELNSLIEEANRVHTKIINKEANIAHESLYKFGKDDILKMIDKEFENTTKTFNKLARNDVVDIMQNGKEVEAIVENIGKINGRDVITVNINGEIKNISPALLKNIKGSVGVRSLDDILNTSQLYEDFSKRQVELSNVFTEEINRIKNNVKKLEDVNATLSDLEKEKIMIEAKRVNEIEAINMRINRRIESLNNKTLELENTLNRYKSKYNPESAKKAIDLAEEIKTYETALNDAQAFETYIRANYNASKTIDDVMSKYNPDVADYLLRPNASYDELVRKTAIDLKKEFYDMGLKEVEIGKLKQGQLDAMASRYVPHVLTDKGKEFFYKESVDKRIKNFGAEFGFGREFNPHSMSRKVSKITTDADEWITNPTIEELNKYFNDSAGGKVFKDNLAEIYIARAIKHNDLMYDNAYMENMTSIFGKPYNGIKEDGYKTIMNYGKLRDFSSQYARLNTSIDVSEMLSKHLKEDGVIARLKDQATMMSNKYGEFRGMSVDDIHDKLVSDYVEQYFKRDDIIKISNEINTSYLEEFFNSTNTHGMLDDIALPFAELNDEHIEALNNSYNVLQGRYEAFARKKAAEFLNLGVGENSIIHDMDIEEIIEKLNKSREFAIDNKYNNTVSRVDRILDKFNIFNEILPPDIAMISDAIVDTTNQARKLQIERDNNHMLALFDKFTHWIKVNQTTVLPSFHVRNKMSNMFNNWLSVGSDAVNIDFQKQAWKAIHDSNFDEMLTDSYKWREVYDAAVHYGVVDKGLFATEVGANASNTGILKDLPGKFDPTDTKNFFLYKFGSKVGSEIENHDRFIHFAAQIKNGLNFEEASEMVSKFNFDYSDLTFFEQSVMKRIIPYYTWIRKNAPLQLEMMLEKPQKYRMIGKVIGGIEAMVDEDDRVDRRFLSGFAQDWIQTPFTIANEHGRREVVMLNPNLPFMDINEIPDITDPIGSMENIFTKINPLLRVPVEQFKNKNVFFDSPIVRPNQTGGKALSNRAYHVASQVGVVPLLAGLTTKKGIDKGFHLLNNTTGVKLSSYDYDMFRAIKLKELEKKRQDSIPNQGILGSINRKLGGY